jgi:hypothetical protein
MAVMLITPVPQDNTPEEGGLTGSASYGVMWSG